MCLRNNQLDDEAIKLIAYGLGDFNRQNQKLINLQLCSNQISDQGAIYLANVSNLMQFSLNDSTIFKFLNRHCVQIELF